MPLLKLVTTKNLIPLFDYELYKNHSNPPARGKEPPIFYLMLNLASILPEARYENRA
jgi:hypothetical protein